MSKSINNPNKFGTNDEPETSAFTPSGLTDDTDFPHTGLFKSLNLGIQGNYVVSGFNISAATASTFTVAAGKVMRDGSLIDVNTANLTLSTSYTNGYHLLVAPTGSSPVTPVLRNPTAANKVPDYTAGDTIIAIVAYVGSTGPLQVQYLTNNKTENSLSLGYDNSGYTETGTLTADANGITMTGLYKLDTLPVATVAGSDKILLQDADDSDIIKTATASSIAGLGSGLSNVVDDTTPQLGGTLESNGNLIKFGDSASATDDRLFFGAGDDLGIWHDGAQSHIYSASRAVYLTGGGNLYLRPKNGEDGIILNTDGAAEVYHDDSKVMETVSDGIKVNTDLKLSTSSDNAIIENVTEDKDILFKGLDGSTTITALSLDISDAGKATFNAGAEFKKDVTIYEDANYADVSLYLGTNATELLTISVISGDSNKTAEEVHFSTATASSSTDAGKMVFDIDGTDKLVIDDAGIDVTGSINATTTITASTILTGADTIGQASLTTQGLFHQVPETLDQTTSAPVMSGANSIVYVFDISNAPSASPPGNSNIVELPDPNTVANAVFTIRNVGSNSIDINVQGGQPIDGGLTTHALVSVANTITLPIGQHVTVQAVTDSVAPLVTGYYIIGN